MTKAEKALAGLEKLYKMSPEEIFDSYTAETRRVESSVRSRAEALARGAIGLKLRVAYKPSYGSKEEKVVSEGTIVECVPIIRWSGRSCSALFKGFMNCGPHAVRKPFCVKRLPI